MAERRREHRHKSLLGGSIHFARRHSAMDCIVRNISGGGAMIVFPHAAITPREFDLHIRQSGETHAAKVIWRHHDRAGVALSVEDTGTVFKPAVPLTKSR